MREITKAVFKFLAGFVLVLAVSTLLAPWLYSFLPFKFDRILRRLIMIGTLGLVLWLMRERRRMCVQTTSLDAVDLHDAELLINATTVGMRASDGCPVDPRKLHPGLLVYDLVYHRATPLVQAATRRGCVAAGGLSMLLYQGAESLRLWLHREPPIDVMRRALVRAIR